MKVLTTIIFSFLLFGCTQQSGETKKLQARIDSLEKELSSSYKPGLGEFMSAIQVHHAKLWFAGLNQNWPLADFEIHEIEESLEDIQKFCRDRPEIRSVQMIRPVIDSITNSIVKKDPALFKSSFTLLTATCNNCHQATAHGFNIVTIPSAIPVVNQDFKPVK
ncbi:MAG: hypothetical protein ABIT05_02515 [Chitinophagaceae bacterium]